METITVSQDFNIAVGVVWKAISDHSEMVKWFFDNLPDFKAEKGFKTRFLITNEGRNFTHLWTVAEADPPYRLKVIWNFLEYDGEGLVTYQIEESENGCKLTLKDEIIEPFPQNIPEFKRESGVEGWNYFIKERLVNYLNQ